MNRLATVTVTERRTPGSAARPPSLDDRGRASFRWVFYALTFSYPVAWLIGAGGLYWILLAVPAALFLLRARASGLVWTVLALPFILFLSSPIGLLATSAGPSRLIGLAANAAVWVSAAAVIHLAETGDESRGIARALTVVGLAQGAITLVAVLAHPSELPIPVAKGFSSSVPGGIGAFMENQLYFVSWLDGEQFRSAGIMGQPTWAGAVAVLALLCALYLFISDRGGWRWIGLLALPFVALSIALSLSRATMLGLGVAALVGVLIVVGRRSTVMFWCLITLTLIGALIFLVTNSPTLMQWISSVNSQREGSFDARSQIYGETWTMIGQHPFPLLGYGVKPQDEDLIAPIATHSAYLGMLFRGGLLGLLALGAVYALVLRRCLKAGSAWGTSVCLFIAVWSILEDADPGHFVPLGLALAVAWARASALGGAATSGSAAQPSPRRGEGAGEPRRRSRASRG